MNLPDFRTWEVCMCLSISGLRQGLMCAIKACTCNGMNINSLVLCFCVICLNWVMRFYCSASLVFNRLLKKLPVFIEYKFWSLCWKQNATDPIVSLFDPFSTFPTCYSRPRFSIKLPFRLRSPEQALSREFFQNARYMFFPSQVFK